mmetsp:Transcript_22792/g.38568  ORF Transcript_22792/g.38568 Transcript_22792/m.38568 type:complete len:91 (+) Transcript_22792:4069-4341(+)
MSRESTRPTELVSQPQVHCLDAESPKTTPRECEGGGSRSQWTLATDVVRVSPEFSRHARVHGLGYLVELALHGLPVCKHKLATEGGQHLA